MMGAGRRIRWRWPGRGAGATETATESAAESAADQAKPAAPTGTPIGCATGPTGRRAAATNAGGASSRTGNPVPSADVAAMFDEIAPVYDRMNSLMTLGSDRGWRRAAVAATRLRPGDAVIDLACGTGKLSAALAGRVGPFGRVLGVDLSPGMVERARHEYPDLVQLSFVVGDALRTPAETGEFDAATIAFGLRNLPDFEAGFREMRRAVRPGGRVVCLELSWPRPRILGRLYHGVFRRSAPLLGSLFRRRHAYEYLPQSLEGFPDPESLAATMRRAGLVDVTFRRLAFGSVALHVGVVPPTREASRTAVP